jgi:hypothetical protein
MSRAGCKVIRITSRVPCPRAAVGMLTPAAADEHGIQINLRVHLVAVGSSARVSRPAHVPTAGRQTALAE